MSAKKESTTTSLKRIEGSTKNTLATDVKIAFLANKIVKEGWTRYDIMQHVQNEWGLSKTQAERYYKSACTTLLPSNDKEWRDALIARNFTTLEEILKRALERENLKCATEVLKTLNGMLGIGGRQVEIKDDTGEVKRTITINFE